ncbi:putative RNA polymerase II subunit B1 CTD phosphatase rpap2 [Clinocottus analis]|uniref:putative RNA polymerase II subunit B1 CTD phosphatase rpap2 n=1 Tax=Clinocottus analis TaxID=304258 RepID=UPI0035C0BEC2
METENRRRSGGSTKTSKKGGKRDKEEAKRREVVMETLGQRLELEKRALKVVERLLEDRVAEDFLIDCARFIAPANYTDAIEERSIAKLCGYPLCSNKLGKIPTQKYKISTKTNKVYDITERKSFCSNFCYKASKEFELQISTTPLWLRQHERPPKIILMKQGDGGSSGEVVMLLERRLQEEDVESPLAAEPVGPRGSQQGSAEAGLSPSESSDIEEEQDFVSSIVSQRQGPRVHWGNLPKRTDEDKENCHGKMERQKKRRGEDEKEIEGHRSQDAAKMRDAEKRPHSSITEKLTGELVSEERGLPDEPSVEEAIAKLNLTNLSETVAHTAPPPVDSIAKPTENTNLLTSPPCKEPNSLTESTHLPSSTLINTNQNGHDMALTSQPGLNITQVGMSRRGAAGLRQLLKNYSAAAKPSSVRLNLLESLRRTLKDWSTDETLKFLYGADHSLCSPFVDVKEEVEEEEELELDEDDLEDEVTNEDAEGAGAGVLKRPSAAAPDYHVLQQETQHLELRVREFYKGTWILPEEEELHGSNVTKVPALPLVDSHAQHLIQKRIAVQKLTSCLRNIVGPLHLNISDFSTDLNKLVKTFRFTSTNIIHKTPEWTFLSVVLLHLLSEVSPVVREALKTPTSAEYLNTLMEELGLQEQDLLNIVQLFKTPAH